ncbi:hypothetical protein IP88_04005 [alpha proteobacterium AAP81b]|nr:hypothetical protein IP88_04005 [alpha proteobacterium AAP81b]
MAEQRRDFIDRLVKREWTDRWAFLLFALGGSLLIVTAKSQGADAILVSIMAIAIMAGYAALVYFGPRLKLRPDQLGDNCYYMGLVFTLASLSYAIFTFDPAKTATTIIQGFGVALASTVVGLVLRVFFSQGQPDLAMAEENARLALTDTAARMRAELDGVVLAFQTFALQTQQHLTELRDQAKTAVIDQSASTVEDVRKVSSSVRSLVKALESHAEAVGGIAGRTSAHAEALGSVETAAGAAGAALLRITASAETMSRYQETVQASGEKFASASDSISAAAAAMLKAAQDFDAVVEARLAVLNKAPLKVSERLATALTETITRWEQTIDQHATSHVEVLNTLAQARADELAALQRHNAALDAEVSRSRDNVAKVHKALVELTTDLTAQVGSSQR